VLEIEKKHYTIGGEFNSIMAYPNKFLANLDHGIAPIWYLSSCMPVWALCLT